MNRDPINQRFINCVNFLLEHKIYSKKGDIAKKLNIKNAKFSEILNLRMNVGIEEIIAICEIYNFNLYYILTEKGEMIKSTGLNAAAEQTEIFEKSATAIKLDPIDELIMMQKKEINRLEKEISRLEIELADCLEQKKHTKVIK
jgi:type I restriction-modification system DNA methylase subunit